MAARRKRLVGSLTVSALLKPLSPLCGMDFVVPNQSQSKKNKSWSSKRVASTPSSYVNEDPSSYDLIDRKIQPTRSNKQPLGKFASRLRESFRPKSATSSRGTLQLPRDAQEAKNVSPNSSRLSAASRYPQPNVESRSTHSGASPSTSLSDASLHNFTFPLRKEIEQSNGESHTTTSYQQESSLRSYFQPPCESPTTVSNQDSKDSGRLERSKNFGCNDQALMPGSVPSRGMIVPRSTMVPPFESVGKGDKYLTCLTDISDALARMQEKLESAKKKAFSQQKQLPVTLSHQTETQKGTNTFSEDLNNAEKSLPSTPSQKEYVGDSSREPERFQAVQHSDLLKSPDRSQSVCAFENESISATPQSDPNLNPVGVYNDGNFSKGSDISLSAVRDRNLNRWNGSGHLEKSRSFLTDEFEWDRKASEHVQTDLTNSSEALTQFQETYERIYEVYSKGGMSPVDLSPPTIQKKINTLPNDMRKLDNTIIPGWEEKIGRNSNLAKRNRLPNNVVLKSANPHREPAVFTRRGRFSDLFKSRGRSKSASDFEKERIPAKSKSKLSVRSARSVEKRKRIKPNLPKPQSLQAISVNNDRKFSSESVAGSVGDIDSKRKGWGPMRWFRGLGRRHSASEIENESIEITSTALSTSSKAQKREFFIPETWYPDTVVNEFKKKTKFEHGIVQIDGLSSFANSVIQCLIYNPAWIMNCDTNTHRNSCQLSLQDKPCPVCDFWKLTCRVFLSKKNHPDLKAADFPFLMNILSGSNDDTHEFVKKLFSFFENKKTSPEETFPGWLTSVSSYFGELFSTRYETTRHCGNCKSFINFDNFNKEYMTISTRDGSDLQELVINKAKEYHKRQADWDCQNCNYSNYLTNQTVVSWPSEYLTILIDRTGDIHMPPLTLPDVLDLSPLVDGSQKSCSTGAYYVPYAAVCRGQNNEHVSLCHWIDDILLFDGHSVKSVEHDDANSLLKESEIIFYRRIPFSEAEGLMQSNRLPEGQTSISATETSLDEIRNQK